MTQYQNKSQEELRIEDYSQGNKGTPTSGNLSGFGAPMPAPGGGLFGSTTGGFGASTNTFGAPAPTNTFGSTPAAPGLFGSTTSPAPAFGAPAPFGAPATGFGTTPSPSTGLFGTPAPATGGFGTTPAPAFGAPAPLFGTTPAPTTGLFGSTAPAPPATLFGQPAPAPAFGQPAPAPSIFGQPAPAPLFGSSPAPAFGAAPAPSLFGQPAPAPSLFGQPAPAPSTFGQPQTPTAFAAQQPIFAPNTQIIPQASTDMLQHQLQALANEAKKVEQTTAWQGKSRSPSTTPTSYPEMRNHLLARRWTPSTPSSRVRPRGFPKSSHGPATTPARQIETPMAGSLTIRPETQLDRMSNQLRVKSDAVRTPSKFMLSLDDTNLILQNEDKPDDVIEATKTREIVPAEATEPPAQKSPAHQYYDALIAETGNDSTESNNRSLQAQVPAQTPTLTRLGYEVYPTMDALKKMTDSDLAAVADFSVSRPGYGKVEWEGCVDVRGANLDQIVSIGTGDISVYHEHEERGEKPPQGHKLNRPAVLTFCGMYPKGGVTSSDEEKEKYARKVEEKTKKLGAGFISYDKAAGVWKIRVEHFSRYCFNESSDEEEEEHVKSSSPLTRSYSFATPRREGLQDSYTIHDNAMAVDTPFTYNDEAYAEADNAARLLDQSILDASSSRMLVELNDNTAEDEFDPEEGDDESVASSVASFGHVAISRSNATVEHLKCLNLDIMMYGHQHHVGRVGFGPDGYLPSLTTSSLRGIYPKFTYSPRASSLLDTQREYAEQILHDDCPLFLLGADSKSDLVEFLMNSSPEAVQHVFEFISDLTPVDSTSGDAEVSMASRVVASARKMLGSLAAYESKSCAKQSRAGKVTTALCNGDIERAVLLARDMNFLEVAAVLASGDCDGDIQRSSKGKKQIGFESIESLPSTVHSVFGSGAEVNQSLWYQVLNLSMAQDTAKSLGDFIHEYEISAQEATVPFPYPLYCKGNGVRSESSMCFHFKLLKFYASDSMPARCLLDPRGYSANFADYELAFHVATALRSSGKWVPSDDCTIFDRISDAYQTQLCGMGLWEQAVFVALCHVNHGIGASTRVHRAKSLVLRFYSGTGDEQEENARHFLESIGVPASWFFEASWLYAAANGDHETGLEQSLNVSVEAGLAYFEQRLLPSLNYEPEVLKDIAKKHIFDRGSSDSLGKIVVQYAALQQEVGSFLISDPNAWDSPALLEKIAALRDALSSTSVALNKKISSLHMQPLEMPTSMIVKDLKNRLDFDENQVVAQSQTNQLAGSTPQN